MISETIDQLFQELNGNHREVATELVAHLRTEHRTLQQSFWRVVQAVACEYQRFDSDLRNESAVAFAKEVAGINRPLPML